MQVEDFEDDVYELIMEYITGDLAMKPLDNYMLRVDDFLKNYQELRKMSKFRGDEDWKCQVVAQESHFKTMLDLMLFSRDCIRDRKQTGLEEPTLSEKEDRMILLTERELNEIIQQSIELITHNPPAVAQQIANKVFSSM